MELTKRIEKVKKTVEVEVDEPVYTLKLNKLEATMLCFLCGQITGLQDGPRGITSMFWDAFADDLYDDELYTAISEKYIGGELEFEPFGSEELPEIKEFLKSSKSNGLSGVYNL